MATPPLRSSPPLKEAFPARFDWRDPFLLEGQLSDEERQIRKVAGRFAQDELAPHIRADYRAERFNTEMMQKMGELGLLAATLPVSCGGAGISTVAYGIAAREIERVDSGYRSAMGVQHSLVSVPIYLYGSEAQKQKFIPSIASGELIGCFGLTEPEAGSDPGALQTRATPVKGGYRLTGTKMWITNAPIAHIAIIWAKMPDDTIAGFIAERGFSGFSTMPIEGKLSLRASPTGEIRLENCFIPEENRLPLANGMKPLFTCLNKARFSIIWGAMGAAEACFFEVRDYVLNRRQFGRPLAATQLIQTKLADMQTEIALGLQGALQLGRMIDQGTAAHELTSLLKRNNCGKALSIARTARDMLGANGITDAYNTMRHVMNLETVNTYEGTYDIHGLVLGRAITGLPAF